MKTSEIRGVDYSPEANKHLTFNAFLNGLCQEWARGSVTEFARQVGVTRVTLVRWLHEPDVQPELSNLKRFADCTKVSFLYLVKLAYPEIEDELEVSSFDPELAKAHDRLDSLPKKDRAILSQVIMNYQPRQF